MQTELCSLRSATFVIPAISLSLTIIHVHCTTVSLMAGNTGSFKELLYFLLINSDILTSEEQQTLTSKVREEAAFEKFGVVMWVKLPHT